MDEVAGALLAAIVAAPADDAPRLVYADYLSERGDPRGELIQLQCRLAREPTPEIAVRIDELVAEHAKLWLADLIALGLPARFTFARGFVERMDGRFPAATTSRADELAARAPLLERLHLTIDGQRDRRALAKPETTTLLARASVLSIHGRHVGKTRDFRGPIADLTRLAELAFGQLRELRLSNLRTEELPRLLRSPALAALDVLALNLRLPSDELAAAAEALVHADLCELDLSRNELDARSIAALGRAPTLRTLVTLRLDASVVPAGALAQLDAPALRELSLVGSRFLDDVRRLADWRGAPALATIDLSQAQVSEAAKQALRTQFRDVQ